MVGTKIHFTAGTTLHPAAFGQIAQLVEQRTENPRVAGSIPALGIEMTMSTVFSVFVVFFIFTKNFNLPRTFTQKER